MASMFPYNNYDRALRKIFQPDLVDDFFTTPLATVMSDAAFKMDVEDELNEGRLSISIDKKETEEDKAKNYLHKETHEWSATRGIYLKDASTSGLSARLENGILTVNVPKQDEKANVTKISID